MILYNNKNVFACSFPNAFLSYSSGGLGPVGECLWFPEGIQFLRCYINCQKKQLFPRVFLSEVLVQLHPSCTQEYKWRELEEQRQAQKLQRQLQQEQAYLLSLQQNQNLDSSKTAPSQSSKPPESLEQDRMKPPEPDAPKQLQNVDSEKSQSHSLEKTTEPSAPVAEHQGPAPDSEPVREVIPRSSLPSH